jgi:mannose-6-phosphate isomerase-like protein (cupin superfamily)
MAKPPYEVTRIDDVPEPDYRKEPGEADWHAIRIRFGIRSFGVNAYTQQEAGRLVVGEHTETDTRHEELYYVADGHATFTIDGEEVDAPEGTLVYVPDPGSTRSAVAHVAGTTVLGLGGTPGEAFTVSEWESKYDPTAAR